MVQDFKYPGHNPAPIWHKGAFYTISSMETGIYTTASLSPGARWTKYSSINQEVSNGMAWTGNGVDVDVGVKVCRCIVQANVVCSLLAGMRCGEIGAWRAPAWRLTLVSPSDSNMHTAYVHHTQGCAARMVPGRP